MGPFHPYRAPQAGLANPDPAPVSDFPRPAWAFLRMFPLIGCGLVSCGFGLMSCYGALALVFLGVEWLTGRPEAERLDLLASASGVTATAIMVTSGLVSFVALIAARRWDACRWRGALVATGGMALGIAASLALLARL